MSDIGDGVHARLEAALDRVALLERELALLTEVLTLAIAKNNALEGR